ncbi:MAG: hypothetical protein JETT_3067 [Candidatus Jettenia ecosi]|uniref:Uncharacterized protein n=1 Tax=Candidatus Jettenia ecosi TaxID=2494326 RepID=A0A533Q8X4_9BACT|nr:MAG: hypothetical protein JETT_3067 [Candidatus Jettenia ecosi]
MKASIIEKFIENITQGKREHFERFYKIFSARGFLLELDRKSGKVRLSDDSHREDGEFLEMLQNIHFKRCIINHIKTLLTNRKMRILPEIAMCILTISIQNYLIYIITGMLPYYR